MPDWSKQISSLLVTLNLDPTREAEIVEELSQHLNDRYAELLAEGVAPERAQSLAFDEGELKGGKLAAALKPLLPSAPSTAVLGQHNSSGGLLAGIVQDLRYAIRQLRTSPGFAAIAILSLALGIGANSAIFQLLDSVRLRTLPVKDPQSLADVRIVDNPFGRSGWFSGDNPELTNPIWEQIRDRQQAFSAIAAWSSELLNLSRGGEAHFAQALNVSGNFFNVLGVQPAFGRLISPADDHRGCGTAAVISYSYWQRAFGGRPLSNAMLTLEGHPFEIIGVTPASFYGVEVGRNFDVAIPICADPIIKGENDRLDNRRAWWLASIGRLKPGWSLERATAQLQAISPAIFAATLPTLDDIHTKHFLGFKLGARSAASGVSELRSEYQTPLWLLMAISGLVLLIACANLANLMLARAAARRREMAVRLALGASRSRLIRQLLAESLLIAFLGAAIGVGLAQILSRSLVAFLSTQQTSVFVDLAPDWRVLSFAIGLTLLTCILFGLTPALQAAATPPNEAMKAGGRGLTANRERFGLRRMLVIAQVAISLVLLVSALLFVRTFHNLLTLDPGFDQDNILITDVDLSALKLPASRRTQYKQDLLARVQAIPGVQSVAIARIVPLGDGGSNEQISIPGTSVQRAVTDMSQISPGYFATLRTPMLAGRDFTLQDTATSPRVAIVTQAFAKRFLGGANPVGKTFDIVPEYGQPPTTYQIIGLVKDSKYSDLHDDFVPIVFNAEAQNLHLNEEGTHLLIRSTEDLSSLAVSVRNTIAAVDPSIVINFTVFKTSIREGLTRERLMATLSSFFGVLAAILAMIGLYGVISYMVVRRGNEIGIRMALGATRRTILSLVLREAATLLAIGLLIGSILAVALATTARSLLYGLKPTDPLTLTISAAILASAALAASLIPARRAAHTHPMQALREE